MTHDEGTHVLQRVSTEKEQWQNRQWFGTLSWSSTASALQGKADAFAVTTVENVITSQATVFVFLSLYHHILTVQTREQGVGVTTVTQSREISPLGNKGSSFSTNDSHHCPYTAETGSRQNQASAEWMVYRKPGPIPKVSPDSPCTFLLGPSLPDPSC